MVPGSAGSAGSVGPGTSSVVVPVAADNGRVAGSIIGSVGKSVTSVEEALSPVAGAVVWGMASSGTS